MVLPYAWSLQSFGHRRKNLFLDSGVIGKQFFSVMPFSEVQKKRFIRLLESKGWQMRDGAICSPGGGLWFSDSHFGNWNPPQMAEYRYFQRQNEEE